MERYEPLAIIRQIAHEDNHFDAAEFQRLISELNSNEFDQFCVRIQQLSEFRGNNLETDCADIPADIKDPVAAWDLKGIEIDQSYEHPGAENNPVS